MPTESTVLDCREVFDLVAQPLWILTTSDRNRRSGLVCTFVSQASLVATIPRVLVGLSHAHFTTSLVHRTGKFVLHQFDESHLDWVARFGIQSTRDVDKFEGVALRESRSELPILAEAICALECRVEISLDIGDRLVFVAEVLVAQRFNTHQPLTAPRLREIAPPEMLAALKQAVERDSASDAHRIAAWRERTQ